MRLDLQCHCGAVGRSGRGTHFPKTAKEELEQGFNALVVESRLLSSATLLKGGREGAGGCMAEPLVISPF